jgi:DNA-binding transcriptional LysR family regulator
VIDMTEPLSAGLLSRLRFKHLRLAVSLGRTANLHRSAEEIGVTQPAATKILQDLEATLGTPLFERSSRGMAPNAIGCFVILYARRTLAEGERFGAALSNLKRGGYGALAVGAIMATAPDLLPMAIAELKRRRPLMTIHLRAATSDQLLAALERGELDLALARIVTPRQRSLFDFEPLTRETLWIFVAPNHPMARRRSIKLAELERLPWVLQPAPSPMRDLIDSAFAANGLAPLDNIVETTSIFATLHLVRHAAMVAVLPSALIAAEVGTRDFVRLPIVLANDLDCYGIVTPKAADLTENAREFIGIVREVASCRRVP